jgi:hypothetical protein
LDLKQEIQIQISDKWKRNFDPKQIE